METSGEQGGQEIPAEYGPEVLCASWNPLVTAVAEPLEACKEVVAEIAAVDVESFLASFYRCQQG